MKKRPSSKPLRKATSRRASTTSVDRTNVIDRAAAELASSMVREESTFYPGVLQFDAHPLDASAAPTMRVQSMKERILRYLRGREDELLPERASRVDARGLAEIVRRMKALFFRRIEAAALAPASTLALA